MLQHHKNMLLISKTQ